MTRATLALWFTSGMDAIPAPPRRSPTGRASDGGSGGMASSPSIVKKDNYQPRNLSPILASHHKGALQSISLPAVAEKWTLTPITPITPTPITKMKVDSDPN
jgi:hypothetical protein